MTSSNNNTNNNNLNTSNNNNNNSNITSSISMQACKGGGVYEVLDKGQQRQQRRPTVG